MNTWLFAHTPGEGLLGGVGAPSLWPRAITPRGCQHSMWMDLCCPSLCAPVSPWLRHPLSSPSVFSTCLTFFFLAAQLPVVVLKLYPQILWDSSLQEMEPKLPALECGPGMLLTNREGRGWGCLTLRLVIKATAASSMSSISLLFSVSLSLHLSLCLPLYLFSHCLLSLILSFLSVTLFFSLSSPSLCFSLYSFLSFCLSLLFLSPVCLWLSVLLSHLLVRAKPVVLWSSSCAGELMPPASSQVS